MQRVVVDSSPEGGARRRAPVHIASGGSAAQKDPKNFREGREDARKRMEETGVQEGDVGGQYLSFSPGIKCCSDVKTQIWC